ncbi:hypothetical protein N7519_007962 [Penicillium mononematosum]|uniref:uncharacterized protein n=1 Tax=Penicillium mononematosum TaxID=268346 RepID=UPI0025493796|nr:uncharacterized protein N7519_007962 [Penicillium mononematosum]KAJ6186661.1 hypothetical protein N7519_007962 [Penicillium mononematosum]
MGNDGHQWALMTIDAQSSARGSLTISARKNVLVVLDPDFAAKEADMIDGLSEAKDIAAG